jgi:aryl-alcohol dehydrogenase-like predicted oxidoreductase
MPYGNASNEALMEESEANKILDLAAKYGIRFFDTAQAYGVSEARIGKSGIVERYPDIEVSTKVKRVPEHLWANETEYFHFVVKSCEESCRLLGMESLKLLQFHQCEIEFLSSPSVQAVFRRLIDEKICGDIGVSVYKQHEAEYCTEMSTVSSIQFPVNILDKRFVSDKLVEKYKSSGKRTIGRSVVLQGVLIPNAPLPNVKKAPLLQELRSILWKNVSPEEALVFCWSHVFNDLHDSVDIALLGVDSANSLDETLSAIDKAKSADMYRDRTSLLNAISFAEESDILDPSAWNI